MDGFSEVLDVVRRNTSHGDTAITGKVDVPVITELIDLLGSKTRVAEHTDLIHFSVRCLLSLEARVSQFIT